MTEIADSNLRRPRWGLRLLGALVVIAILGLAVLIRPAYLQRQAIAKLQARGIVVQAYGLFPWIRGLNRYPAELGFINRVNIVDVHEKLTESDLILSAKVISLTYDDFGEPAYCMLGLRRSLVRDKDLLHFVHIRQLKALGIASPAISDLGLSYLRNCRNLRSLWIGSHLISDAGLRHLAGLTELDALQLEPHDVTDAGLESIESLSKLRELRLTGAQIKGPGLIHLSKLRQLEILDLDQTQVSADALGYLSSLTELQELGLCGTGITDDGLLHLTKLTQLSHLRLASTEITASGLKHLVNLPNLEELHLQDTRIDKEEIRLFRREVAKARGKKLPTIPENAGDEIPEIDDDDLGLAIFSR